jgi:hypothetical protein
MKTLAILFLAGAASAWAGICSAGSDGPRHDFQFFAGYSPVPATLIGTTTDRQFLIAGFGYNYRCWVWPSVSIAYSGEMMPAAVLFEPKHAVYGFAITPVGFTAEFLTRHRIHPYLQTNEGIIASAEPIPINAVNATGLNFVIDVGGGVRIRASERRAISLGYKFLHISNGFTSAFNPGVDNNVFYAGFSILR